MRTVAKDASVCPRDGRAPGELQICGPWVADAYLGSDGDGCFATDAQGRRWLRTGDIAHIDPDGYVRLIDRAKDLIKSGGEWISTLELESVLLDHPSVHEAAIVGVPDPVWQERPVAFVALKPPAGELPDLRAFLKSRLQKWQVPDKFVFLAELPKASTGKLDKARMKQLALGTGKKEDA